jgi:hypothetical protein
MLPVRHSPQSHPAILHFHILVLSTKITDHNPAVIHSSSQAPTILAFYFFLVFVVYHKAAENWPAEGDQAGWNCNIQPRMTLGRVLVVIALASLEA